MLSKILSGAGGAGLTYSDITVVTSGSVLGNATATFSPTLQQDDVVFMIVGDNATDYTIPAGYLKVTGDILTGIYRWSVYYKVMGATPDTGIALSDGNDSSGCTYYALRGVQTNAPTIEVNYVTGTTSPANLTPPALTAPTKSLFLVAGFTGNGASATLTAAPSGYSGFRTIDAAGNSDTFVGSAYKTITAAGTETPGAFTLSSTAAAYAAVSIVVRPYSAGFVLNPPTFVSVSSKQNTVSGTTLAIPMPAGTVDGNLMVAFVLGAGGSVPGGWTGPAGWNEVAENTANRPVDAVYWKTAASESGADYTFTAGTSRTLAGSIITYSYGAYDTISSFSALTQSPTIPSVTATTERNILLAIGGADTGGTTVPLIGMTSRLSNADATAPSFSVADQYVAKGPVGYRQADTGAVSNSNGIMLLIKPTR